MNIEKLVQKYKNRIAHAEENINDYTKSNNPELLNCVRVFKNDKENYEILVSALEKQIVMRKLFDGVDTYNCPCCSQEMESDVEYCQYCGQKTLVE